MKIRKLFITVICVLTVFAGIISPVSADTGSSSGVVGDAAREKVWNMMWQMGAVKWKPSTTVYHMHQSEQISGKTYYAGTNYVGMPYTASMKSLELFSRSFQDPDGDGILSQFQPWVPTQYKEMGDENIDTIDIVMGNDCSGAIYWAVSTVSNVEFLNTRAMMPANNSGLIFAPGLDQTKLSNPNSVYSRAIIGDNTDPEIQTMMYAAYDTLQKGDILVGTHEAGYKGAEYNYGHTVMVESVDTVNRTITVLQHGGPAAEWKKKSAFTSDYANKKSELDADNITTSSGDILWNYGEMSYEDLLELYYLPLSVPEYYASEGTTGAVYVDNNNTGKLYLASGTVTATSLRLQSVTIEIKNEDGTELDSVTLDTTVYRWKMYQVSTPERLVENSMDLANFAPYLANMGMKAGKTYIYKLSARLTDGNDYTLKEYMFVY